MLVPESNCISLLARCLNAVVKEIYSLRWVINLSTKWSFDISHRHTERSSERRAEKGRERFREIRNARVMSCGLP